VTGQTISIVKNLLNGIIVDTISLEKNDKYSFGLNRFFKNAETYEIEPAAAKANSKKN